MLLETSRGVTDIAGPEHLRALDAGAADEILEASLRLGRRQPTATAARRGQLQPTHVSTTGA
jgi:hypothetical protein